MRWARLQDAMEPSPDNASCEARVQLVPPGAASRAVWGLYTLNLHMFNESIGLGGNHGCCNEAASFGYEEASFGGVRPSWCTAGERSHAAVRRINLITLTHAVGSLAIPGRCCGLHQWHLGEALDRSEYGGMVCDDEVHVCCCRLRQHCSREIDRKQSPPDSLPTITDQQPHVILHRASLMLMSS